MIRDVLLGIFGVGWLVVITITAWRTGFVPTELWAALGVGTGGLLAVFRTDGYVARRTPPAKDELEKP
jgi:hypothetical protein